MGELKGLKNSIRTFWDKRPCGTKTSDRSIGSKEFFEEVEKERYELEYYMSEAVDFKRFAGKKMLEIGCGLGTDSLQFVRNGANVTGIDLTLQGIELTKKRFELYEVQGNFLEMDMQHLGFKDNTFDAVYSNGVIHHTPNIEKTIEEIHRVLKPGGDITIMIYHKNSYYYYGSIMFFKKIGFRLLGWDISVTPEEWLAYGTDGFGNKFSQVFTRSEARELFKKFRQVRMKTFYLSKKDIPIFGKYIPRWVDYQLGKIFGWCLYIYGVK